ncbi:MAG: fatty acid--CoA ligase family protein [Thermoleophilia bacterium]
MTATEPPNLYRELVAGLADDPDAVVLVEDGAPCTAGAFLARIAGGAARIAARTSPGDRVAVPEASRVDRLALAYACFATGRTAVFLPGDAEGTREVLEGTGAVELPDGEVPPWDGTVGTHDPALIIHTSGTTATLRKGVLVSHECVSGCAAFMNTAMGVTAEIREVLFAPVDHLYGFGRCHAVLTAGGALLLATERSNLMTVVAALRDGYNALALVPAVFSALLSAAEPRLRAAGGGVRWIQTGAMRLEGTYRELLLEVFPGAVIGMHYGLTEVMRATFLDLRRERHKLHTEGRPRPGVRMEIRDGDGRALPAGTEGEVVISGPALAMGYTLADEWHRRLTPDGWYRTGDIGLLDEDGYFVFAGRGDDIVNVNGNLVHPMEVEGPLGALVDAPFCVVGARDPLGRRDSVLVLCVEGAEPPDPRDVARHLSALEDHKVPRHAITVPELPRTATGKVRRRELARIAAEAIAA